MNSDYKIELNQLLREETIKKLQYESYDEWITNFSLNLINIWNDPSANELTVNIEKNHPKTAIVIGRGPSIKKFNHLELLANSDYDGCIVCCDGKLKDALNAGVTPEKFPNYYVVSIDPAPSLSNCYDDEIVNKYGSKIKGIFSTIVSPLTVERAKQAGIQCYWIHPLFDYNEGKKSFNYITAKIVRAKNHPRGLPAIQTGGNVGTSAWFTAWKILNCSTIVLIGMNHGWDEDDPWDVIIRHGTKNKSVDIDRKSGLFKKLFPKIYNPFFKKYCILDPIFQFYSTAFKEFVVRSPDWVNTINATGSGSIFGDRITCTKFDEFLKEKN